MSNESQYITARNSKMLEEFLGYRLKITYSTGTVLTGVAEKIQMFKDFVQVKMLVDTSEEDDYPLYISAIIRHKHSTSGETNVEYLYTPLPKDPGILIRAIINSFTEPVFTRTLISRSSSDGKVSWESLDGATTIPAMLIKDFTVIDIEGEATYV